MGVERLQLCVRFCNGCGLFPSRMILDPISGRFKRFEGHWRHPANWWLVFLLICYLIFFSLGLYFMVFTLVANETNSIPIVLAVVLILYSFNVLTFNSIPRLLLFRLRHLETAVEILDRIDRVLEKMPHAPCTTRQRTLIVMIWNIFAVNLLTIIKLLLEF